MSNKAPKIAKDALYRVVEHVVLIERDVQVVPWLTTEEAFDHERALEIGEVELSASGIPFALAHRNCVLQEHNIV